MSSGMITLNTTLPIKNGTIEYADNNSLINYFISVAVLAEMAMSKKDGYPWLIEERFNKRRNSYEFDKHLQNMLLLLDDSPTVSAKCIPCGNKSYYKAEIILDSNIYVHFCRNFDKSAKYNYKYLMMNEDLSKLRFCCFEYTLSSDKTKVTDISLLIPRLNNDIRLKLLINFNAVKEIFRTSNTSIEKLLATLRRNRKR